MIILKYFDLLLFGPVVQYAVTSRYSLGASVMRLRSVVKPWYRLGFHQGLWGTVSADSVRIAWYRPLFGKGPSPRFDGAFVDDTDVVKLTGIIGVPRVSKFIFPLFFAFMCALVFVILPGLSAWSISAAMVVAGFATIATIAMLRVAHRDDYQRIADALDAVLS
jgi:hypothetical protein